MNARRFGVGLFCLSAALLGYELLLMRLLTLAHWGHFAGFVISIAMLGLAASGLFLHFLRERIIANAAHYFSAGAGWFALLSPLAFAASQQIPFKPFLLAWSAEEYFHLGLRSLLLFIPFFCGGIALGAPFVARALPAPQLYFWNMLGSSAPFFPLFFGMKLFHPVRLLIPVTLLGTFAACRLATGGRVAAWSVAGLMVSVGVAAMPFDYSEYKDLSKALILPEAKVLEERYSPQGVVHAVQSRFTRYLPGLSLNYAATLPRSELVFVDGTAMEVVFDAAESLNDPGFLRMSPEAFSYQLCEHPRVLSLYGGPLEILRGLANHANEVISVDDVGARGDAIDRAWRRLGGSPLQRDEVRRRDDEARHYLQTTREFFDVILLSLLGSHGSSTAGAASLDPSYLFTVEGFSLAFERLTPRGHAVLSAWVENPPRSGLRLAALIVDALRNLGIADPDRHLLALRSWSTVTFLVARQPYEEQVVERLKKFADENSFDLVSCAGITAAQANRFNVIPDAPYFHATRALLGANSEEFRRRWPFRLDSPTDDRPFFSHHFRWKAVPESASTMGREWIPFVEWGYLLQAASLLVAGLLGFLLLIVPCLATRARPSFRTGSLFLTLGVAYLFVEMWAIYKMIYLLSFPVLASAVVLTAMLAASGAGAALLARKETPLRFQRAALGMIVALLLLSLAEFPALSSLVFPHSLPVRSLVGAFWIAAPAFFMGFPFPHTLARLHRREEIPWALALNGFGSVLGSLGATLVAVHFGLTALAIAGTALYVMVGILLPAGKEGIKTG